MVITFQIKAKRAKKLYPELLTMYYQFVINTNVRSEIPSSITRKIYSHGNVVSLILICFIQSML